MGQAILMTDEEYQVAMMHKGEHEIKWKKHVKKLEYKKPEWYDVKTPIPNNPDRCFVC